MSGMITEQTDAFSPVERLALAYATPSARPAWEALLLFQHRLLDTARPGREPLMIQLRLAWWRDRLSEPATRWPKGEPLLDRLLVWEPEAAALVGLVNGWEAKVVGEDGGVALAAASTSAYVALGRLVGEGNSAAVELSAAQFADPSVKGAPARLSRKMRPLSILGTHARRMSKDAASHPIADIAVLVRVGLFGR